MRDLAKMKVKKRDGTLVDFNSNKIGIAIHKAFIGSGNEDELKNAPDLIENLERSVVNKLCDSDTELTVENIQDIVESILMKRDFQDVAKHYILYRDMRSRNREANSKTTKLMRELTFSKSSESDIKRENGNINGDTSMGLMLKYGSENAKEYALDEVLKPEHAEAHRNGDIHIHDLDFYTTGTLTCDQIDIHRLFHGGFTTGHGYLREPNSIRSYAALACIAIQANQNDMHGGQSIPNFDFAMAEGVNKSFKKAIIHNIESYIRLNTDIDVDHERIKSLVNNLCKIGYNLNEYREIDHISNKVKEGIMIAIKDNIVDINDDPNIAINIIKQTIIDVVEETHQAMEAVVHNLNSMHSRAGSQVPFSSLNYGMDTSDAGRLVIKEILNAVMAGMGNGETAIFPINIFVVKDGINFKPGDINYDLYKYSMKVTAKRLFPNYLFIDAPFNLQYYKEGDINSIVATMGAVAESEMIMYVVNGIVHYSDFGSAYNVIKSFANNIESTYGLSRYIDTKNMDVFIKDRGKFVRVKKFIRNVNYHNWYDVTFGIFDVYTKLTMTLDHPLPVSKDGTSIRKKLEDIKVGDYVFTDTERVTRILSIEPNTMYRGCGYDVETESDRFDVSGISSHNCRTRVIGNVHGPEVTMRRGNTSFTTINLPRIGLKHRGDIEGFFKELDKKLKLVEDQLYERLKFQGKKRVYNFPFLMGNENWIGSEDLGPDDELFEIIKNGSLSIGFIGLAEALVALIGKHHGESKEAQELGLKIIGHMRNCCDEAAKRTGLNYSLLGTPAEGLSGRFIRMDKKIFGEVKGVTDRDYYTNSSHVPVYYNINAFDKIAIEAPYHALCNAGHIGYIELDGDPSKNIDAIEEILAWMKECGIGYGSINHPVDYDPVCGYTGIIDDTCPRCGRHEYEGVPVEKLKSLGVWKNYNASTIGYHGDNYEEEDRTPNSI